MVQLPYRPADDWFITLTGKKLYLFAPKPSDFCLRDIVIPLANICRFGGQLPEDSWYSVAQHSLVVAEILSSNYDPLTVLTGLMHDATEAYLGDVIYPLKQVLGYKYRTIERWWNEALAECYGLRHPYPDEVRLADAQAMVLETTAFKSPLEKHLLAVDRLKGIPPIELTPFLHTLLQSTPRDVIARRFEQAFTYLSQSIGR